MGAVARPQACARQISPSASVGPKARHDGIRATAGRDTIITSTSMSAGPPRAAADVPQRGGPEEQLDRSIPGCRAVAARAART
ncbi:MAG: hypothetical protein MZV64_09425 [Ignavibacteriales bacterium]|nr:hypothetical protein [Ignavibacteriales bacterium]